MYKFSVKYSTNGREEKKEYDADSWLLAIKKAEEHVGGPKFFKFINCNMVKANG